VSAAIRCVDNRFVIMRSRACGAAASTSVTCHALPALAGAREKSGCLAERSSGRLAGTAVLLDLEVDLLAFNEVRHTSALDGGNVDENVRAAIVGLNKAEALGAVEPLNGASSHMRIPYRVCNVDDPTKEAEPVRIEIWEIDVSKRGFRGATRSIGRNINTAHIRLLVCLSKR
jgi:hypothetical protein